MAKSENYVLRFVPATPMEVLLDKLAAIKALICLCVITCVVTVLMWSVDMVVNYYRSSNMANDLADLDNAAYEQEYPVDDNYVAVNDEKSVQLMIRRAGEEDWRPYVAVAGWHDIVEIRVLTKWITPPGSHFVKLDGTDRPVGDDETRYMMTLGMSGDLVDRGWSETNTISEICGDEDTVTIHETIYRCQVTAKGWWEGNNGAKIQYLSDDAEELASVWMRYDFGYISRANVMFALVHFVLVFGSTILAVFSHHKILRKLRLLDDESNKGENEGEE